MKVVLLTLVFLSVHVAHAQKKDLSCANIENVDKCVNAASVCAKAKIFMPDYIPQKPSACPVGANGCSRAKFSGGQTCGTVAKAYGLTSTRKCNGKNSNNLEFKTAIATLVAAGCCGSRPLQCQEYHMLKGVLKCKEKGFVAHGACDGTGFAYIVKDEDNKDQPMHAICRTYTRELEPGVAGVDYHSNNLEIKTRKNGQENWNPSKRLSDKSTCEYNAQAFASSRKKCKGNMETDWGFGNVPGHRGVGFCSDESKTTKKACLSVGTCSNIHPYTYPYWNKTTELICIGAGSCTDATKTTESTCMDAGTCSDQSKETATKCMNAGTCRDISKVTESECINAGTCSNTTLVLNLDQLSSIGTTTKIGCTCTAVSVEEKAFIIYIDSKPQTCNEMQNVCINEKDANHETVMDNCPVTCAVYRNEPCPVDVGPASWTPRIWLNVGFCNEASKETESACINSGRCSNSSRTQTECVGSATWIPNAWFNTGTCRDTSKTTYSTCSNGGTCSNSSKTTETDCVGSGTATWTQTHTWTARTWTRHSWTPYTWNKPTWSTSTNEWKRMTDEMAKKCCRDKVSACYKAKSMEDCKVKADCDSNLVCDSELKKCVSESGDSNSPSGANYSPSGALLSSGSMLNIRVGPSLAVVFVAYLLKR